MEKPPARPVFRKLAIAVAIVCFLLAVVFGLLAPFEEKLLGMVVCVFVGMVMMAIGITGYWPPRRNPRR